MKTKLAWLLAITLGLATAASSYTEARSGELFYKLDVSSAGYTYYALRGRGGDFWGDPVPVNVLVKTSGSSTTISAVTASTNPFAGLAVGDVLYLNAPDGAGTPQTKRVIATYSSADSVVVDTAVTIPAAGTTFGYKRRTGGTADTDGWFTVSGYASVTTILGAATVNATSIDMALECRIGASPPTRVCSTSGTTVCANTVSATAAGAFPFALWSGAFTACRVGTKVTGDAGAQSISGYAAMVR